MPAALAAFAVGFALPRASPAANDAVAHATATVVRSATPVSEAASLLLSSTPGVLTIAIPGASGGQGRTLTINAGGRPSGVGNNSVVLSLADAQALNAVIAASCGARTFSSFPVTLTMEHPT